MPIETSNDQLNLKQLTAMDVDELHRLIQQNSAHLTQNGDYTDLCGLSLDELKGNLVEEDANEQTYGMIVAGEIIGTVSLIHHHDRVFGLGYWIGQNYTGKGYATAAARAIIELASKKYGATEIWAGIKHINHPSIKLVKRLGFTLAREQPTHRSYKLTIHEDGIPT